MDALTRLKALRLLKARVAIITNLIPTYRRGFYDRLLAESDHGITVYIQKTGTKSNIEVISERYDNFVNEVSYWSFRGDKLVWHRLPYLKLLMDYDILVVDGNPRHLSQAILSTVARLIGKKVVIWSTFTSRRNVKLDSLLRQTWWRLFEYFLMYTEREACDLVAAGWSAEGVISVNNGLDQKVIDSVKSEWEFEKITKWKREHNVNGKRILLSAGRVLEGRFDFIMDALKDLVAEDSSILWILVGDGEGMDYLRRAAKSSNLESNVIFAGSIYDEEELAPWFLSSDLFIYSEAIGLSLMHAFGYGLPAIIHDEMATHGPEASIFTDQQTGLSYEKGNLDDFKTKVRILLNNENERKAMGHEALSRVKTKYNAEIMAKQFSKLIKKLS